MSNSGLLMINNVGSMTIPHFAGEKSSIYYTEYAVNSIEALYYLLFYKVFYGCLKEGRWLIFTCSFLRLYSHYPVDG